MESTTLVAIIGVIGTVIGGSFGAWQLSLKLKSDEFAFRSSERQKQLENEKSKLEAKAEAQRNDDQFRDKQLNLFITLTNDIRANTNATLTLNETILLANQSRDKTLSSIVQDQSMQTSIVTKNKEILDAIGNEITAVSQTVAGVQSEVESLPGKVQALNSELTDAASHSYTEGIRLVTQGLNELKQTLKEQQSDSSKNSREQTTAVNLLASRIEDFIVTITAEKEGITDGITTE